MVITGWKQGNSYSKNQVVAYVGKFYKSKSNRNKNVPVTFVESNSNQNQSGIIKDALEYVPQINQSWEIIEILN